MKMPMILLLIFNKKNAIFNSEFFPNSSKLPSVFIKITDKYLSTVTFYENEIKKAIHNNLDPNKAHEHGMLSIHMLKICGDSLCGLLRSIFQSCFENGKFPSEWKKANVVPTYNKNDKLATIVQSCYFQFVVRSLNALFITNYFISFKETTLSHQINLNSNLGAHAPINYWLLLKKHINHLTCQWI